MNYPMMILITNEAGSCLHIERFNSDFDSNSHLFSGAFSAIMLFMEDVLDIDRVERIEINDVLILITRVESLIVTYITAKNVIDGFSSEIIARQQLNNLVLKLAESPNWNQMVEKHNNSFYGPINPKFTSDISSIIRDQLGQHNTSIEQIHK